MYNPLLTNFDYYNAIKKPSMSKTILFFRHLQERGSGKYMNSALLHSIEKKEPINLPSIVPSLQIRNLQHRYQKRLI